MPTFKNHTPYDQAVTGFPVVKAGETIKVSDADAERLRLCPNLTEVTAQAVRGVEDETTAAPQVQKRR